MEDPRRHGLRRGDALTGTTTLPVAAGRTQVPVPRRLALPAAIAVGIAGWAVALRLRDPHVTGSWGSCPFLALTGLPCPACGGLRAVNDLTHGDVVGALGSNLLAVALLPVFAAWWVLWVRRCRAAGDAPVGATTVAPVPAPRTLVLVSVVVVVFTVVRWLPFAAWLAP